MYTSITHYTTVREPAGEDDVGIEETGRQSGKNEAAN